MVYDFIKGIFKMTQNEHKTNTEEARNIYYNIKRYRIIQFCCSS